MDGFTTLTYRDETMADTLVPLAVLAGMTIVLFLIAIPRFKYQVDLAGDCNMLNYKEESNKLNPGKKRQNFHFSACTFPLPIVSPKYGNNCTCSRSRRDDH